jgi:hypothetical protein
MDILYQISLHKLDFAQNNDCEHTALPWYIRVVVANTPYGVLTAEWPSRSINPLLTDQPYLRLPLDCRPFSGLDLNGSTDVSEHSLYTS